jgi:uncharacterized protein YndB with AHSA1/START domain
MTAAASANKTTFTTDDTTNTLIAERWFDAPRDLVWAAMNDPERIPRWWGRHGDVTTVIEHDPRVGGTWRYVSRGPDGIDHPFKGEFLEIDPPSRAVQTFIYDVEGFRDFVSVTTVELIEEGGRTRLVDHNRFATAEQLAGAVASGMETGQAETYERLEAELATMR